jgi:hypothetical protein
MAYTNVQTTGGLILAIDEIASLGAKLEVVKIDVGAAGATSGPVSAANPMPVASIDRGRSYAAGVSGNVSVPSGSRMRRISAIAGTSGGTVTILGGAAITLPANASFDEDPGNITGTGTSTDVQFSGTVSYYVSWEV